VPIPTTINEVVVVADASQGVAVGKKIGPGTYQLSMWGGKPTLYMSYRWESRAGGVKVASETCQVFAQVLGPDAAQPSARSAWCTQGYTSQFSSSATNLAIHEAGTYTVRVTEELSGVVGTVTFTVVG